MTLVALTMRVLLSGSSPVFRFRSKWGKLLLETSKRSLWPVRKTLEVDQRSSVSLYSRPGS